MNRFAWVDYAKGIAIILVVYRHLLIGIERSGLKVHPLLMDVNMIVYTFRMPLFFVLAGFFIGRSIEKRNLMNYFRLKFNTVLYPYLVWTVIQITVQILFKDYINANRSYIDFLYIIIKPRALDQFWYLYALFNISILFVLFQTIGIANKWIFVVIGLLLQLSFTKLKGLPVINDICFYFLFMAIGNLFASQVRDYKIEKYLKSTIIIIIILPIFVFMQWYWLNFNSDWLDSSILKILLNPYENPFLFSLIALTGTILALSISIQLAHKKMLSIVRSIGYYSLYIFLMHAMIGAAARILLLNILKIYNVFILLAVESIIAIGLSILVYKLLTRFHLGFLFSLRKGLTTSQK